MKKFLCLILAVVFLVIASSCGAQKAKTPEELLQGKWRIDNDNTFSYVSFEIEGDKYVYSIILNDEILSNTSKGIVVINSGTITLQTDKGETYESFSYTIAGDIISLTDDKGQKWIKYN